MILNDEQKAMLEGKYGEGAAYAMKIQVGIGECFDAQRMVPIKRAHVALSLRPPGRRRRYCPHDPHGQCLPCLGRSAQLQLYSIHCHQRAKLR